MIKNIQVALALLVIPLALSASSKDSIAVKYANTITEEDLNKHLTVIASDEYEGRDAGSKGQKLAAEYIKTHFVELGIPPLSDDLVLNPVRDGYFQEFSLKKTDPSDSKLKFDNETFHFGTDFFYLEAPAAQMTQIDEMVFCGFATQTADLNELDHINIDGKYVVFIDDLPRNKKGEALVDDEHYSSSFFARIQEKREQFKEKGAAGVFVVMRDIETKIKAFSMFLKGGRVSLEDGEPNELPMIFIKEEMLDSFLAANGSKLKKLEKKITKTLEPHNTAFATNIELDLGEGVQTMTSENVLGFIEGRDLKEEVVVITAHFDHVGMQGEEVYNGADDDGSGTVALLELAEAFAQAKNNGHGPRRSVLLMTVSAEEKGLLGSKYYTDHPIFPLESTVVDLNIDMIGRFDEAHGEDADYVYLIGSDRLSTELHSISESANTTYTNLQLDYTFNDPDDPNKFYYRSDHYNFAKNNIPVIFYFSGVHEDYHEPTDTVEKIHFDKLQKRTHLIFHTAWELANRNDRIQVDVINDAE